ncbi:MAG: phosphoribosylformimino-5-aminoimidazole carboxamide ribotide isomerase [Verrucomicrobiia bacterium]|jgi:phosphoribosylformimino-5-aminoimidazole carboxamide ribotide isomerase
MFRPCIDLHEGKVKQIVGGSFKDNGADIITNFVSERPASWYAELYKRDGLKGGHIIMLGQNAANENAATSALSTYPGGMQIGGGINLDNAKKWLDAGASHIIVTSFVFREAKIDWDRLNALVSKIGKERLVLDLSCRKRENDYFIVTDKWQKFTNETIRQDLLEQLSKFCAEFLVHSVDVEGLRKGVDIELVEILAQWSPIPVTYAGGARSLADLELVTKISRNKVDLTIGSALDIFGGKEVKYSDVVEFNRKIEKGLLKL